MHVETDQWLMVENARKAAAAVPGAAIATLTDATAHYGVFKAPNVLKDTIKAFVDDSFTASLPGSAAAAAAAAPPLSKPAGLAK